MLEVKNIIKSYGENTILDDISLSVQDGSLTGLIGPNGAGKSTLLTIIGRLIKPDSGEILLNGKSLSDYANKEIAKSIAILRQSNTINIRLTVKELVAFGRFPHTKGRLNKNDHLIIDEAINCLDLTNFADRYIDELSGGERQRAMIAMVVAQDTQYILLDEPLNNLDMKHANEIMVTLKNLVKTKHKTVLIVLHDINCASFFCEHIVALKDGRIAYQGKPAEIMQKAVIDNVFDVDCQIERACGADICVHYTKDCDQVKRIKADIT